MGELMLQQVPVWMLVILVIVTVTVAVQAGIHIAHRVISSRSKDETATEGVGAVVGALLGLLGFMLAFTFSMAADLDEVNSIGTTYLRAGLIPEPLGNEARPQLRRYVDLRIEVAEDPTRLLAAMQESSAIQKQLWASAETLAEADLKNADIVSLYVDSLNETIDLQTSRLAFGQYRIPTVVWVAFGCLTVLSSLSVGYNFGLQSPRRHRLMTGMLAVSFASVTFLILDLDHGNQGWLKVDQQPMYNLRDQLKDQVGTDEPANRR
jgi:hypothetical protein